MSYLDLPRVHFAGKFQANPSTINNIATNYDPAQASQDLSWNPNGSHSFNLVQCKVKSAVLDASGTVKTSRADDPIIEADIEVQSTPVLPNLVDLDPEWQHSSQVYGLQLSIKFGSEIWLGTMETATLRDLWITRAPNGNAMLKSSGSFQSVAKTDSFTPVGPSTSAVFNAWKKADLISIRFVTYAYDTTTHVGQIVGTLGPSTAAEPRTFLNARRLDAHNFNARVSPRLYFRNPFGPAPFKVDEARKRLVIDLGNALPETASAGQRVNLGTMRARVTSAAGTAEDLGTIDYSKTRYETTAGVEEVVVTDAQLQTLKTRPLEIWRDQPYVGRILSERPRGTNLELAETTLRMNPGESRTVDVFATRFGRPESNLPINARLTLSGWRTTAGLTFTVVGGKTDANGRAQIKFTASDPGKVRFGGSLDGQLYFVDVDWGKAVAPAANDWRGRIVVKVYDTFPAVASPKWADVAGVLTQYARLYPYMKARLDLSAHVSVKNGKDLITLRMTYPETDPRFMPTSRDLSKEKRDVILRWLAAGAP